MDNEFQLSENVKAYEERIIRLQSSLKSKDLELSVLKNAMENLKNELEMLNNITPSQKQCEPFAVSKKHKILELSLPAGYLERNLPFKYFKHIFKFM